MNRKRKVSLGLISLLMLSVTIIQAEEKIPVSEVTIEETAELIQADPKLAVEFYKFLAQTYIRAKRYEKAARSIRRS